MPSSPIKSIRLSSALLILLLAALVINAILTFAQLALTYSDPSVLTRNSMDPLMPALSEAVTKSKQAAEETDAYFPQLDTDYKNLQLLLNNMGSANATTIQREINQKLQNITSDINNAEIYEFDRNTKIDVGLNEAASQVGELQKLVNQLSPQPDSAVVFVLSRLQQVLGVVFSWPFVVFLLLLYLLLSKVTPQTVANYLQPFKSIELFGAKIELSEQIKSDAEASIQEYRKLVKKQYDLWSQKKDLRNKFVNMVDNSLKPFLTNLHECPPDIRCTIHVPDILFADTLYQLLDYYPKGGGRGRAWSTRYGIIGKAWRLGKPEADGTVPTDSKDLIASWGMTSEEADYAAKGRQSFCTVIILDGTNSPIGIFYMDAQAQKAFGDPPYDNLYNKIKEGCQNHGITQALIEIRDQLSGQAPIIQIYDSNI